MNVFKFKLLPLIIVLLLLTSLCACAGGSNSPASGKQASEPQAVQASEISAEPESSKGFAPGVTVMDQAGREVLIKSPVERIVSGYYISSSACIALGLKDNLVGIEAKAASRPIYSMAAPELPGLPDVGTAKEFNMEACVALEPDLVILPKRLIDSAEILDGLGIPVILVNPESHDELTEMIKLIGTAAGAEKEADSLIGYYNDELAAVSSITSLTSDRPSVYMCGNGSYLTAAPNGMYQASLIDAAGGINAADIEGDNWTEISYEQIAAMNPQVMVIPAEAAYGKDDILNDVHLKDISAVRDGRVYQMPKDFEAWDSPVPSCTLGIRWLLSTLHEDVYSMEDMRAGASGFYKEFYGVGIDTSLIGK